jgi:hypothetical protein
MNFNTNVGLVLTFIVLGPRLIFGLYVVGIYLGDWYKAGKYLVLPSEVPSPYQADTKLGSTSLVESLILVLIPVLGSYSKQELTPDSYEGGS